MNVYQYKNQWVDRFNPFIEMKIGYATLPTAVTYNGGKEYDESSEAPQYPDPYKDIWVLDDPFGESHKLTFSGGQAPEGKTMHWFSIKAAMFDVCHLFLGSPFRECTEIS
ncbi:hypothetical protein GQR36_17055 [Enterococcus termitis]